MIGEYYLHVHRLETVYVYIICVKIHCLLLTTYFPSSYTEANEREDRETG